MKTKEERKKELQEILKPFKQEQRPLTFKELADRRKDPRFNMHVVSDCKYDDKVKNKRLFKDWKKHFEDLKNKEKRRKKLRYLKQKNRKNNKKVIQYKIEELKIERDLNKRVSKFEQPYREMFM